MSGTLNVTATKTDNGDYIVLRGNIDVASETALKELPARISQADVRFDFSGVSRINSMGIALLLRCLKNIREERKSAIYLRGLSQTNAILFKMTGLFNYAVQEK